MKILYVTTIGITMRFFKSFIRQLLDEGHEVDIATNETESMVPDYYREWGCTVYPIDTSRSPLNKGNFTAIKQIKKIASENEYDIVHCHTPVAAMCTRLACRKLRRYGTKVFYTAHGFHFYKGAPFKNWMLYYPVEKICSYWTDVLITINQEDYALAKKKMKAKQIEYVPGVGIDVAKFTDVFVDNASKRAEIGVPQDAFLLISVGELNKNKNHEVVINALAELHNFNIHYAIVGKGELREYLANLATELGVAEQVHLLGYRSDISELFKIANAFVHPSYREGLPVSVMEAMASGLSCIVSKTRGNVDLIEEDINGLLCAPNDIDSFQKLIIKLYENFDLRDKMKQNNINTIYNYSRDLINEKMIKIYKMNISKL